MLHESDLCYTITDVYSGLNDLRANTILQFYLKDKKHLCADEAIWVCDDTEVIIDTGSAEGESSIAFIDKSQFDGNPSYRKLRAIP